MGNNNPKAKRPQQRIPACYHSSYQQIKTTFQAFSKLGNAKVTNEEAC